MAQRSRSHTGEEQLPLDLASQPAGEKLGIDRTALAARLARLAGRGLYFGTSSWKYAGWEGIVYERSGAGSDHHYLREYGRLFPTVCADFTFYRYPDPRMLHALAAAVPDGFTFAVKVTQSLLIDRFPQWFKSEKAGTRNGEFLSVEIFVDRFLDPVRALGEKLGPIIFEFGEKTMAMPPTEFTAMLDGFFERAPRGPLYAVEIRRKALFTSDHFAMLRRQGVAHVLNSQESAPPLGEQIQKHDVFTAPHCVIRALTPPRVSYRKSVQIAEPFDRIVEERPETIEAVLEAARRVYRGGNRLFAYINNRLEGCAPLTIARMLNGQAED